MTDATSNDPAYNTYYAVFTTTGSSTWVAPATCQSPITYWIVGGGGGGAGAFDQRGNGGGGGGSVITGTYFVVPGTTYTIFVGAGVLEELVEDLDQVEASTPMEQMERIQVLILLMEAR